MWEWMNEILCSIFISIPETMLILLTGFALCNLKVALKKIIFIALVQAIVAFIVKVLDVPYGLHTIVLTGILWLLVILILHINMYEATLSVLAGLFVQGVLQLLFLSIVTHLFSSVNLHTIRTDFKVSVLFSYSVFFFSIILLKIIQKKKLTFI